ncbi:sugar transferase [Sinorhizobium sojae]|uniref:sugar transferase n=1 Tax=Sinorhizobium sojae TaxID=716925 RepID=UPI000557C021|nr:sugar transferase [Sinorhizobium sojae]
MKDSVWSDNRNFQRTAARKKRPVDRLAKRGFDIGGASLGLVFLAPLLVLLACLVMFSDGGPALQRHLRVGRGGSIFTCLTFRTTTAEGEAGPTSPQSHRPAEHAEHALRLTPVGAVLTRLGLVDLPQFINVLRGDMSFVGPRPVAPGASELIGSAGEFYLESRPGMTGPWRAGASEENAPAHRPTLTRRYVETWSFFNDLRIIAKSVTAACLTRSN